MVMGGSHRNIVLRATTTLSYKAMTRWGTPAHAFTPLSSLLASSKHVDQQDVE